MQGCVGAQEWRGSEEAWRGNIGWPGASGVPYPPESVIAGGHLWAPEPISAMGLAPVSIEPLAGCWPQGQVLKSC